MPHIRSNCKSIDAGYFQISLIVLMCLTLCSSCSGQKEMNKEHMNNKAVSKRMIQTDLKYNIFGQGDEIVFLIHGLGSNGKAWNKLVPYLEKDYKLYAIDLPKYLNIDDKSQIGISNYSKQIANLIEALNFSEVHLVGHSMGAQIAIHLANHTPKKVKSLTLLAPAGFETFSKSDEEWFKTWVTKSYYLNLSDIALERSFDINFYGSKMPEDAQFMLDDRKEIKKDEQRYSRYVDYVLTSINSMLQEPVYNDLNKIIVPTLVLLGMEDQLIPNKILHKDLKQADMLEVANKISGSEAYIIDNAGHFIQWDRPKEVASKFSTFLNNNFTNQ